MIKVITREGALKAFYYFMAVDGVTSFEQDRFEEIGMELLGESFASIKEEIISECESSLESITLEDERYDVIQESIDQALSDSVSNIEEGVVPRLLIWDMLTLAYSDSEYAEIENRLISHVARILKIDKSVFAEMKQLISVAFSVQEEKKVLENSTRPYSEIRPLVDEVEKRQQIIAEAAKALIADDIVLDDAEEKEKSEDSENFILATGKIIGDSVVDGGKWVGEKVSPLMKNIGDVAVSGATGIADGAGKLFSKVIGFTKKKNEEE